MKLQHNLGGLEALGPVEFEKRVFVEPWETRIFGIHVAMMSLSRHLPMDQVPGTFRDEWTWADLRKGAEAMHPFEYFKYRYYEKWLGGISGFFMDKGYITEEELDQETRRYLESPDSPIAEGGDTAVDEQVYSYLRAGDSPRREAEAAPRFKVGDRVVIKDQAPTDHTRLPGYLRNKVGVIETVYDGAYAYFCNTADGLGAPMPVYCVRFSPEDIWGELAEPNMAVLADLFETYVEPA